MNKIVLIVFTVVLIISPLQLVYAQEISLGEKARQKSVEVYISEDGTVQVKHIIGRSSTPGQIDLVSGTIHNLKVIDEDGNDVQHAMINGDLGVLIFPSVKDKIVEYEVKDALSLIDGVWTWDFLYLETTKFFFPSNIDMFFISSKPVLLDDKKAINCHGCQMLLEYFKDENIQYEKINGKDRQFKIPIISLAEINNFEFLQSQKNINFEPTQANKLTTIILPVELLAAPYEVYQEEQQIKRHDYITNDTHVWLSVRPESTETVTIKGEVVVDTSPMEEKPTTPAGWPLPLTVGIILLVVGIVVTIVLLRYKNKIIHH